MEHHGIVVVEIIMELYKVCWLCPRFRAKEWTLFCPNEAFDEKSGKTLMDPHFGFGERG